MAPRSVAEVVGKAARKELQTSGRRRPLDCRIHENVWKRCRLGLVFS
jgi:hypothetical protein